jgi:transcriptional regulator with PAS, ATPase and Fis domain
MKKHGASIGSAYSVIGKEIQELRSKLDSLESRVKELERDSKDSFLRAMEEEEDAFIYVPDMDEDDDDPKDETSIPSLEQTEKELICKALERHKGKRKDAAKTLGIGERTIYRKIEKYKIDL